MTNKTDGPAKHPPAPLYRMPGHLIRRCHQISAALFIEECGAYDITPQQYAVLSVLAANDGVDQITLAGLAALNRTTAGEVIDRMERSGLVKRRDNDSDRRVKNIFVTRAGRRRLDEIKEAVERVQQRLLEPLEPRERTRFVELLTRIADGNNELSRAPLRSASKRRRRGEPADDGA
jgi:DNA-binding MarR family transcriptional regulator